MKHALVIKDDNIKHMGKNLTWLVMISATIVGKIKTIVTHFEKCACFLAKK